MERFVSSCFIFSELRKHDASTHSSFLCFSSLLRSSLSSLTLHPNKAAQEKKVVHLFNTFKTKRKKEKKQSVQEKGSGGGEREKLVVSEKCKVG